MGARELWIKIHERFDPSESLDAERAAWRADRALSPAGEIVRTLSGPFAPNARILVTGTVGTGKTTELLRIAEQRDRDEFVVFLDLAVHFDKVVGNPDGLQHISQWEVAFLAALAVYRCAEERVGVRFDKGILRELQAAWTALAQTTETKVPAELDVSKLASMMFTTTAAAVGGPVASVVGKVVSGAADAVGWSLSMGQARRRLPDDDDQIKTMLNRVNRVIAEVQSQHRPVLLLIDGLDRIRDIARARDLFVDSNLLARLACRVVICGPWALRHHPAASAVQRFDVLTLANEPVLDQHDPTKPGPGLAFFTDLFRRRVADLPAQGTIPPSLLDRIAYYSGGRARDFVKIVRVVAQKCWEADVEMATDAIVENALDKERGKLETGLHRGHIDLLENVMADPDHRLADSELVWDLLTWSKLLPYPDHTEWFYPHPLLTLHLLRPAGSTK